jgi:hypothetical protein
VVVVAVVMIQQAVVHQVAVALVVIVQLLDLLFQQVLL